MSKMNVPFFRVMISEKEIAEVVETLRSGWLTTGPKVKRFEEEFARKVGASYAIAVNSCTAALHLSLEAIGLKPGEAVLVPTHTFAATAEVVRYMGAIPILVDCDPDTMNMDLQDAERKINAVKNGKLTHICASETNIKGMLPVHVGGYMMDMKALKEFASAHDLWIIEDAAHAFPASWRPSNEHPWEHCGAGHSQVACFSFYANKTITTGEGGMAVTNDPELESRIRVMSLHGLSKDAWSRYSGGRSWDYRIVAPGFKYNLTDIAASIGIHQLERAESMRLERKAIAEHYTNSFSENPYISLPGTHENIIHSWHLYPIRLKLDRLKIERNLFVEELRNQGIGFSVHWRPLHEHPYYEELGWKSDDCPVASEEWTRLVSLPFFSGMTEEEAEYVIETVNCLTRKYAK